MDTSICIRDEISGLFMKMSDQPSGAGNHRDEDLAASLPARRPASWLDETELRRRARRRNALYWMVAAGCMLLFVVLIYLLLERTRWSAGGSTQAVVAYVAH